jgi:hypothetical protein
VRLVEAEIGGDLDFSGGHLEGVQDEGALQLGGAQIKGSLYLHNGFSAKGTVALSTAKISGYFNASGGTFEGRVTIAEGKKTRGSALDCDSSNDRWLALLKRSVSDRRSVRFSDIRPEETSIATMVSFKIPMGWRWTGSFRISRARLSKNSERSR